MSRDTRVEAVLITNAAPSFSTEQHHRSRRYTILMAFKLIEAAQDRWRAVNAPHLVALVRAGATFEAGKLVERPDEHRQPDAA